MPPTNLDTFSGHEFSFRAINSNLSKAKPDRNIAQIIQMILFYNSIFTPSYIVRIFTETFIQAMALIRAYKLQLGYDKNLMFLSIYIAQNSIVI